MTDDVTVNTQSQQRRGRATRWAYVIVRPGEHPYVSAYRYASDATALRAGVADAADATTLLDDPPLEKPYYGGGNYGGRDLSSGSQ